MDAVVQVTFWNAVLDVAWPLLPAECLEVLAYV